MNVSISNSISSKGVRLQEGNIIADQVIAGILLEQLEKKREELAQNLGKIAYKTAAKQQESLSALHEALGYVQRVRDFVAPEHLDSVLGNMKSKHGEIAEQVEVQIRNAMAVMERLPPVADIDSVGRTAPEDYLVHGTPVQSKFIAGFNNTLEHVTGHMDKYPDFVRDAAAYGYPGKPGYYHIPKDHFETIQKILHGDTGEFNQKTIRACHNFVHEIEEKSGKSFCDVVKPSLSKYSEVQLGTIDRTLDGYEDQFRDQTAKKLTQINDQAREQAQQVQEAAKLGLVDAGKAGLIGAAIGGAVSGGIKIYIKIKEGKSLNQFTLDDWKSVGIDFGKGAVRGGISGTSIFVLTQRCGFAPPFAGAMVSTAIGIASLAMDCKAGRISKSDFADAACSLSVESGLAAVGAAIGTALIPVPVVGAVVGTMAARAAIVISSYVMGQKGKELISALEQKYEKAVSSLDAAARKTLAEIKAYYDKMDGLIEAAMNKDLTLRMTASIELCRHVGVAENEIVHTIDELDDFMLS